MKHKLTQRSGVTKTYYSKEHFLIIPPLGCPGIFPVHPCPTCPPCPCTPGLLNTETFQYTAISNGTKMCIQTVMQCYNSVLLASNLDP